MPAGSEFHTEGSEGAATLKPCLSVVVYHFWYKFHFKTPSDGG